MNSSLPTLGDIKDEQYRGTFVLWYFFFKLVPTILFQNCTDVAFSKLYRYCCKRKSACFVILPLKQFVFYRDLLPQVAQSIRVNKVETTLLRSVVNLSEH